jgi:hypothetical protein
LRAPTACKRTVSGTISLSYSEYFSPFPYGTGSLSVIEEYLALPDGAGRFTQDFSGPALLRIPLVHNNFYLQGFHLVSLTFPGNSVWCCFLNAVLQPWGSTPPQFRLFPVRSPLLRESLDYFLFLQVLRCFSSLGWLPFGWYTFSVPGCPIRKSSVITLVCSLPKLIAAYHVLHRLSMPRHPPYALIRFKYVCIVLLFTTSCYSIHYCINYKDLIAFPICQRTYDPYGSSVMCMDLNHSRAACQLHL